MVGFEKEKGVIFCFSIISQKKKEYGEEKGSKEERRRKKAAHEEKRYDFLGPRMKREQSV
jgi:hypothetical protein